MSEVRVPVSFGELIDKLTILEIKLERMADPAKRANVEREYTALSETWNQVPQSAQDIAGLRSALKAVNERLWLIEDEVREHDARQDFGPAFIELARSVYLNNDERARLKREINLSLGSALVEEKSYDDYGSGPTPI
ncbi:MAG: DUF6165 family protein [Xanthomonadales bacterium]|nr:DUF6165 family protein [Xanthomonadales bacterium]